MVDVPESQADFPDCQDSTSTSTKTTLHVPTHNLKSYCLHTSSKLSLVSHSGACNHSVYSIRPITCGFVDCEDGSLNNGDVESHDDVWVIVIKSYTWNVAAR